MVAWIVFTCARQIEGEYVFVMTNRGFADKSKADALKEQLRQQYVDEQGKFKRVRITTPQGEADCYCEVGVHDVEIEGVQFPREQGDQ